MIKKYCGTTPLPRDKNLGKRIASPDNRERATAEISSKERNYHPTTCVTSDRVRRGETIESVERKHSLNADCSGTIAQLGSRLAEYS